MLPVLFQDLKTLELLEKNGTDQLRRREREKEGGGRRNRDDNSVRGGGFECRQRVTNTISQCVVSTSAQRSTQQINTIHLYCRFPHLTGPIRSGLPKGSGETFPPPGTKTPHTWSFYFEKQERGLRPMCEEERFWVQ